MLPSPIRDLEILPQPDDVTCGPTSLHAVYGYYGEALDIHDVIREVDVLESQGTLAVLLGLHALRRGYGAAIHTYNLAVFDPTWFDPATGEPVDDALADRLREQASVKDDPKLQVATRAYLDFLELGGRVLHAELGAELLVRHLSRGRPILTGLSATYLYGCAREIYVGGRSVYDDVRGEPQGHFVVLYGWREDDRRVLVADPLHENPRFGTHRYAVDVERLLAAILLGVLTYDANLLVLEPPSTGAQAADAARP